MQVVLITDSDLGPPTIERATCESAGLELVEAQCRTEEEVLAATRESEPAGLLVQYAPITAAVIKQAPTLRAVARYGVGLDNVDVEAAEAAGVSVLNVPDYCVDEVADHTLALSLALLRAIPHWARGTRHGEWLGPGSAATPPRAVSEVTFGLAGFGRIAQAVAMRAAGFGAKILAHDPLVSPSAIEETGVTAVDWPQLWEQSDLVSLHMSLTPATHGIVNVNALRRLRPGSHLVNTSRAGLVDRAALESALQAGLLGGVGLDVWWEEPAQASDRLLRDDRLLLTPHVAYLSTGSLPRLRRLATERLLAAIAGAAARAPDDRGKRDATRAPQV